MITRIILVAFVLSCSLPQMHAQWQLTNAPKGVNVYAFATNGSVVVVACDTAGSVLTGGAIFRSTDNGEHWVDATGGLEIPEVRAVAIDGAVYYMGTFAEPYRSTGGVYRSTDNGLSWVLASKGLTNRSILSLAVFGTTLLAGTYEGGVFWSPDSGSTWIQSSLDTSMVFELLVHGSSVFASTYSPPVANLLLSTDGGVTWAASNSTPNLASLATDGSTMVGTRNDSVFISTDDGLSWSGMDPEFPNPPIMDMVVRNTNIFALTNWGNVFHSGDFGGTWTQINEGLIDTLLHAMAINDLFIFAGGDPSSGVWRRMLSEVVTNTQEITIGPPDIFALEQNFPNPFNPTTTIRFTLHSSLFTTLMIYNILGQPVASLVNEKLGPGTHSVTWDATGFPSGVYFCTLKSGAYVDTKKLVLTR